MSSSSVKAANIGAGGDVWVGAVEAVVEYLRYLVLNGDDLFDTSLRVAEHRRTLLAIIASAI